GPVVAFLGAWEATEGFAYFDPWHRDQLLVALSIAVAVASYRLLPVVGLAIVWLVLPFHFIGTVEVMKVELFVAVLAYGLARYGDGVTVVASAVSVPAAAVLSWGMAQRGSNRLPPVDDFYIDITGVGSEADSLRALGLLAFVVLAVPWLLGLMLRATSRVAEA